jgi:pimeloyl-ACP methyl ester carboxylesterase
MNIDWLQSDVKLDNMTMHYTRTGGDKPPLVLAHGFSDHGLCWLPVAQILAADYDVILPDACGHGLSSRVQPGETVNNRAADLAAFITVLELNRPVVGGHSMGGLTASVVGAHHPELTRALILEDPAWIDRRPGQPPMTQENNPWIKSLQGYASQSLEEVIAKCRAANPLWPEIELQPWAESKKQLDLNVFKVRDSLLELDWKEIARKIGVPTLLITGDVQKGGIISPENAQKACEMNPLIRVAHIDGVGHSVRRENFSAFMTAVKAFLKDL